jgi:hypothetical protein
MSFKLFIKPINGLGDKIINVIGAAVYCHYKNFELKVFLNESILFYFFGSINFYDLSLFNFNSIHVDNTEVEYKNKNADFLENAMQFINPDAIVSITPYCVYQKLKDENINVSFQEVSDLFIKIAKNIQPSNLISECIPIGIENAYGIHLRKSDKIKENPDIRHEMSPSENAILMDKLLITISEIIEVEEVPVFYVTSEDNDHKQQFSESIKCIAKSKSKQVTILETDPENIKSIFNYSSVLDLFCLSKCKTIIQGTRYSAFSVVASLIGNQSIVNLSRYLESDHLCIMYLWNSVLNINGEKNFDEAKYKGLIDKYKELNVFYGDFYISW